MALPRRAGCRRCRPGTGRPRGCGRPMSRWSRCGRSGPRRAVRHSVREGRVGSEPAYLVGDVTNGPRLVPSTGQPGGERRPPPRRLREVVRQTRGVRQQVLDSDGRGTVAPVEHLEPIGQLCGQMAVIESVNARRLRVASRRTRAAVYILVRLARWNGVLGRIGVAAASAPVAVVSQHHDPSVDSMRTSR